MIRNGNYRVLLSRLLQRFYQEYLGRVKINSRIIQAYLGDDPLGQYKSFMRHMKIFSTFVRLYVYSELRLCLSE